MFEPRRLAGDGSPDSAVHPSETSVEPPGPEHSGPGGHPGGVAAGRSLTLALWALRAGPALMLVALVVAASVSTPLFMTTGNIGNVLDASAVIAVLAIGQLLVILTRGIDLSVGSTLALATVLGALVFEHGHGGPLVIGAMLATGLTVGTINGVIFVYGRVPHPFIVTLATLSVARGLALLLSDGRPKFGMPESVVYIGGKSIDWFPHSGFVVAALAVSAALLLGKLVWGRWIYAVGGNPEAARRTGIPRERVVVSVYVLSGLAAGVAAVITAGRTASGSPNFGDLAELDAIAAVIIGGAAFAGGRGHVGNALIGAFMIGVIRNVLNLQNVDAFYQMIVIGLVILAAVEADVIRGRVEERFRVRRGEQLA
jgi:ribose transport system permease protein